MEYSISKKVQEAGLVLGAFGVIGFIGIVWLMIYGNLSGNLGFTQDSAAVTNETEAHLNSTNYTLTDSSGINLKGYVITTVWGDGNQSNGTQSGIQRVATGYTFLVPSGNYSVVGATGVLSNATNSEFPNVSVSYTYTRDSTNIQNTEGVIGNVTGGFLTFFSFSGTWFTIAAIVLLIFMLVGLLAIVMNIAAMQGKAGNGKYSGN